jgi:hypothetical protein
MNRVFRKLNLQIAPILLLPLLMTSLTGIILGLGNRSGILPTVVTDALLVIHQGRFLGAKIAPFYVLFLGLGVLAIGLNILIKVRDSFLSRRDKPSVVNLYKIVALILVFPLSVCVETGVAYRLGTDWLGMTSQQTAIFGSMHSGTPLAMVLGILYTLVTGFSLILLSIIGVETSLITKTSLPQNKLLSSSVPVEQKSESTLPLLDNISLLRRKIRNAILIFSLIFLAIISIAISSILPSLVIVGVVFTFPAYFIAERLIQDWQKQREIQPPLKDLETESATILRAIPDSMLRMTEDGICLSYIPAKEANSFVITGEIINKHINEFLEPKIALRLLKSAQLSLKSGSTHFQRFPILLESGGRQYYEARISAIGMAEVLIMIRQLSDLNSISANPGDPPGGDGDTIFFLSELELAEILELNLNQIAENDHHHVLCCFIIEDLAIDLESGATSDSQQDSRSRISEILMYQIAAKIKHHLASDYIARLSDNELVTLVLNHSLEEASILINRLREDLDDSSFQWEGNRYPIKTSVGLLEINADSINTTDLINLVKATCNIARQRVEVRTFW